MAEPELFLIVVAAGASSRYGGGNKLLELLGGKPVFVHSLEKLSPAAKRTVLVVPVAEEEKFRAAAAKHLPGAEIEFVPGGACRTESVGHGLAALEKERAGFVAVHDAARPLATCELLEKLLREAEKYGGAIPARPVADSLKYADASGFAAAAPERDRLFAVATPQVFELEKFRAAFAGCAGRTFTDDAELFRAAGFPVKLLVDEAPNWKLTRPADLSLLRRFPSAGVMNAGDGEKPF